MKKRTTKPPHPNRPRRRRLSDPDALRELFYRLQEGIYITNQKGEVLDANPALLEIFGVRSLRQLQTLRLAADAARWDAVSIDALLCAAHDLKGLGATYGFPLVTAIAASLCRLTETDDGKAVVTRDPTLARAHVDALRAIVRDSIRAPNHPLGSALHQTLEAEVAKLGVAPR